MIKTNKNKSLKETKMKKATNNTKTAVKSEAKNSSPKAVNPAKEIAKKIVDKIQDRSILMSEGVEISGETVQEGMEFVSTNMGKASVIVTKIHTIGNKNPSHKLKFSDGSGVERIFSGFQARRAFNIMTKPAKIDKSISPEEISTIENALDSIK